MDEILKYFPRLSQKQVGLLELYKDLLLSWNTKINLISRQDTEGIAVHHILHSLAIAKCFDFSPGTRILDLGTGGGLPGIPLAIYFPTCYFTLIDSRGKKIMAVQAIIKELRLENATAVHTRVEDFEGEFDYVVSRAVGSLSELWNWSKQFLTHGPSVRRPMDIKFLMNPMGAGGKILTRGLIVLKGGDVHEEFGETGETGKTGEARKTGETGKSGTRPYLVAIRDIFHEPYFDEKFIVFVPVAPVSPALPA